MPLSLGSFDQLLHNQLLHGGCVDIVNYLPPLGNKQCPAFIGKVQGQLLLLIGVHIAGSHDKIAGRQHTYRILVGIHKRLIAAVNIDILNPLHLGQHQGQGRSAQNFLIRLHSCIIGVKIKVEDLILPPAVLINHPF